MDFIYYEFLAKPLWMWACFVSFILFLIVLDLGVFHRKCHVISMKEAFGFSAFYIAIGLCFSIWIWYFVNKESAFLYLTGFVVEKSLAMDNIFVIATIFTYFAIPKEYQHRVLVYGILGVIILRGLMIGAGVAILQNFEWVLYVFAGFLIITGIKMLIVADQQYDVSNNPVLKFMRKHFRVTDQIHGDRFVVRQTNPKTGKLSLYMTPLLLALIMIEIADIIFAVDSIPAIFAITKDPYIVYTSNIFAILGLRSLYFVLAAMINRFEYLKYALALVLIFIGSKIFIADMLNLAKIPPAISLIGTLGLLLSGIFLSLWKTRKGSEVQS